MLRDYLHRQTVTDAAKLSKTSAPTQKTAVAEPVTAVAIQ
jgi:hypothetical protein